MANKSSSVHYNKSPLIEAVFEVFFPVVAWTPELSEQVIKELKTTKFDFGQIEQINFQKFNLNLTDPNLGNALKTEVLPRIRFWSKDRSVMFQFGPDMVAVNALVPYKSIDEYLPLLENVLKDTFKIMKVNTVATLGQRFINEFVTSDEMTPDRLFTMYPKLPQHVRGAHPSFALQVETLHDENKSVALNLEYRGDQVKSHKYLLDIYLRSLMFSSNSISDILNWMKSEHKFAVETFEAALTAEAKKICERIEYVGLKPDISK